MQPGFRGSPATHSRTGKGDFALSRAASILVNTAGMCCAIRTGTERLAGRFGNTRAKASGPPVETPIATTCTGESNRGCAADIGKATRGGGRGNAPSTGDAWR